MLQKKQYICEAKQKKDARDFARASLGLIMVFKNYFLLIELSSIPVVLEKLISMSLEPDMLP